MYNFLDDRIKELEQALEFHLKLDKLWELQSPNKTWPESLIEYFNGKFLEKGGK